jgi:hypothetical protein
MADSTEDLKRGLSNAAGRVKTLFNLPTTEGGAEGTKKADNVGTKVFAPGIPAKTYEKKTETKKESGGGTDGRGAGRMERKVEEEQVPSYKKGGKVKKTGLARLHKGEKVLTTKEAKHLGGKKKEHGRKRG